MHVLRQYMDACSNFFNIFLWQQAAPVWSMLRVDQMCFPFLIFFYIEYYKSTIGCSSSVVLRVTWIFMLNAVQGYFIFVFEFVVFQTLRHTPSVNVHHTIWEKSNPTDLVGKCGIHMHKGWKHLRKH